MAKLSVWDGTQWIEVKGDKGDTGDQGIQGVKGDQGDPGTAATVSAGSVTTGAPGSEATVSEAGTLQARIFNFTIPRGDKGDPGENPLHVGTTAPASPTTGKIWFNPNG